MQVHPTRSAIHLAVAGGLAAAAGVALQSAAIVAWGGSILLGLAIARAVTEMSVARIRAAGFEMLWQTSQRSRRVARGERVELAAEVRNRDVRAARYVGLRPVASPELRVTVSPAQGEVPAGGRLRVTVTITGKRVGHHAVHGLSLEVQGGPGLFEVPLTFANPHGIEVLPHPYARMARLARGGRSRRDADRGRANPLVGESGELRELRQHQPGDPLRRIAWRASARRGQLLVREYERDERDVVFLLVDAAVELFAGQPGEAALDRVLDEAAAVALRHIGRGDRVGLAIVGRRPLAWLPPDSGTRHSLALLEALAHAPSPVHAERSGLDEADTAVRVLEHMRPLDPVTAGDVGFNELDRIARRVEKLLPRSPFPEAQVFAPSRREQTLRRYLEAFGLGSPARLGSDRAEVDALLSQSLVRLRGERPRASLVYLWTPPPERGSRTALVEAVTRMRSRRASLIWASVPLHVGIEAAEGHGGIVGRTLARRSELAQLQAERALRKLGVQVERLHPESEPAASPLREPPELSPRL